MFLLINLVIVAVLSCCCIDCSSLCKLMCLAKLIIVVHVLLLLIAHQQLYELVEFFLILFKFSFVIKIVSCFGYYLNLCIEFQPGYISYKLVCS